MGPIAGEPPWAFSRWKGYRTGENYMKRRLDMKKWLIALAGLAVAGVAAVAINKKKKAKSA